MCDSEGGRGGVGGIHGDSLFNNFTPTPPIPHRTPRTPKKQHLTLLRKAIVLKCENIVRAMRQSESVDVFDQNSNERSKDIRARANCDNVLMNKSMGS